MWRTLLIGAGCFLAALWASCWSATVVPGSSAVIMQWITGNALAALTGAAFGAAAARSWNASRRI